MQFKNDNYEILTGDSRNILKELESESVQCVITSPPYWGLRDYGHKDQIGLESQMTDYLDQLRTVFQEILRILKKNGVLWLIIGDGYTSGNRKYRATDKKNPSRSLSMRPQTPKGLKDKDLLGIPWHLAFLLQKDGYCLRNDIIWHKPNAMPESVKDRPQRCHEYIFMFSKSNKYYFNPSGLMGNQNKILRSVWTIKNSSKSIIHSATFPKELVNYCLNSSTQEDDIILDPFCGIGTVGITCLEKKRKFIGIELNQLYVEDAISRLDKVIN